MKFFGVSGASAASWIRSSPLRVRVTIGEVLGRPPEASEVPGTREFDEDGREYVFRFSRVGPASVRLDRERIFEYIRTHRLPSERDRAFARAMRNRVDFFADVRDIQTSGEIETVE